MFHAQYFANESRWERKMLSAVLSRCDQETDPKGVKVSFITPLEQVCNI